MSDAPERIWADCQIEYEGNRNNYHHSWDDDGPRELFHEEWCIAPTEYIRADLHAAAIARAERDEAALAAAEEALRLSAVSHRVIAGMDLISASAVAYNAARNAETALAKIAALKGGAA